MALLVRTRLQRLHKVPDPWHRICPRFRSNGRPSPAFWLCAAWQNAPMSGAEQHLVKYGTKLVGRPQRLTENLSCRLVGGNDASSA